MQDLSGFKDGHYRIRTPKEDHWSDIARLITDEDGNRWLKIPGFDEWQPPEEWILHHVCIPLDVHL